MSVDYEYDFEKGLYRATIKTTYRRSDMSMNDWIMSNSYKFNSILMPYEAITIQSIKTNGKYAIISFYKPTNAYDDMRLRYKNTEEQTIKTIDITRDMLCVFEQTSQQSYIVIVDDLTPGDEYEFWITYNLYKSNSVFATAVERREFFDYTNQKTILARCHVWQGSDSGPYGTIVGDDDYHWFTMTGWYQDTYTQSYQASPYHDQYLTIVPDRTGYTSINVLCKFRVLNGEDPQTVIRLMLFMGNRSSNSFRILTDTQQKYTDFGHDVYYCISLNISGYSSSDIVTMRYGFQKSNNQNTLVTRYSDIHIWFE